MILGILGWLSLFSSYILVGVDVEKNLRLDLKLSRVISALMVIFIPLIFYAIGLRGFLELVALIGGIFLGIEGILIVLMWRRANVIASKPPLIVKNRISKISFFFTLLIFAIAVIYEIIKLV